MQTTELGVYCYKQKNVQRKMFKVAILSYLDGTRGQNRGHLIKIRLPFKTAVLTVPLEIQVGRLGAVSLNLNGSFFQTNQNPLERWLRGFVVTAVVDADTNQKNFSFIFSTCVVFVHIGKACPSTITDIAVPF